jgi:hypothetical protein
VESKDPVNDCATKKAQGISAMPDPGKNVRSPYKAKHS